MSQQQKAAYFRALKGAGVEFSKHYREYTEAELKKNLDALVEQGVIPASLAQPLPVQAATAMPRQNGKNTEAFANNAERAKALRDLDAQRAALLAADTAPVAERDPDELPGARQNTQGDKPIRTDPDTGRLIYQEEVLKPGYPKPRGRRVLRSMESATVQQTVQDGRFSETFEVAGDGPKQATEVKITLPSYQTGIVKDPRFPFKIHTYNGVEGFDFEEVCRYYNGAENVPPSCKRMYVENVLCYDMRSVIQTINAEFRQLQLAGRIK